MKTAPLALVPTSGGDLAAQDPILVSRGTAKRLEQDAIEVFEFWKLLLSNARSRLDQDRRKKIVDRLKDGYSVDDLKLAVFGCAHSDYHKGMNERRTRYQDIELICRDAKHVDKFIEIGEREAERIVAERERKLEAESFERAPMPQDRRAEVDALLKKFVKEKRG